MSSANRVGAGGRIAILYDCVYPFVPGGGQKRLFEICRRLVRMGWQVDWYGLKSWPEEGEAFVEGVRFIPVAPARPLYGADGKRSIFRTLYYGLAISRFPGLRNYDRVHMGQWPYFHFFPVMVYALFGRARISVDWWEVWAWHWLEYYGMKGLLGIALERICSRIPSRLVAISEVGARQLVEIGVRRNRIQVIHNGIEWERIRSTAAAGQSHDLIYVGRLQPHKNVDCLVRAVAELRSRGQTVSLAILGDGPERGALERLVAQMAIESQVTFLGAVASDDDVYAHLRASKVFVHPSTKEGGGSITSLEANAAGLPVVAFIHPNGISPELIDEGVNGHWVAGMSPEALADGIDRALIGEKGEDSRGRCKAFAKAFDWDSLAAQYNNFFRLRDETVVGVIISR